MTPNRGARVDAVDLHCHTIHSDGELIPAEFFRRAEVAGLLGVALTDHVDASNLERIVAELSAACEAEGAHGSLLCAAGVELTHVRPPQIASMVASARRLGARFVVVHGESPVEPVVAGTNRSAIEAGCDLLAHPGRISEADARRAAERGVLLEISGKAGHSLANGHVASLARKVGARVVYGGDTHRLGDMRSPDEVMDVLLGAGLGADEAAAAVALAVDTLRRVLGAPGSP